MTVRVENAPQLSEALRAAMPGWPLARWPAPAARSRELSAWREGSGYCQAVPGRSRPRRLPGLATASCSLIADLISLLLDARPQMVGLHCAAVEVAGRLVLFPATHRAGKSLLSAAFAAAGYRVFGDDVLMLSDDGQGRALGIAPRLRLPLPPSLSPELARFIAEHDGVSDDRYRYLALDDDRLAGHGEARPIGAIVMLDRLLGTPAASLSRLSPGDGLLQLLGQSLAGEDHDPARLLERLLPMMHDLPCRLLRYDDPMAAVEAVAAGLAEAPADECRPAQAAPMRDVRPATADPATAWRRLPVETEYALGEEHFLVDAHGGVHRLSAVAGGIWRLLGLEPLASAEVAALLAERFPDVGRSRLGRDVALLFADLAAAGLIAPVDC
ncbi:PqqD family peptide modification chaperone [Halomonas maura]|uniref:PqqD family peptide modification chaperone n=1 Tax=Halomonas maura TaxID=117606 RepID=UPI0025B2C8F8|nr:PqqD family peptide modification chaperone [Halomonas maura]MDN3556753.1 PqqD family peptide modification chaperone [Halomonas maura]